MYNYNNSWHYFSCKEGTKSLFINYIDYGRGFYYWINMADRAKIGNKLQTNSSGKDKEYIDKMELAKWEWKVDRYGYSYIKGR